MIVQGTPLMSIHTTRTIIPMKTTLILLALSLAPLSMAQDAPADADAPQQGRPDREQMHQRALEKFDKDGDGKLNEEERAEAKAFHQKRQAQGGEGAAEGQRPQRPEGAEEGQEQRGPKGKKGQRPQRPEGAEGTEEGKEQRGPKGKKGQRPEGAEEGQRPQRPEGAEEGKEQRGPKGKNGQGPSHADAIKRFDKDGDGKLNDEERAEAKAFHQKMMKEGRGPRPEGAPEEAPQGE